MQQKLDSFMESRIISKNKEALFLSQLLFGILLASSVILGGCSSGYGVSDRQARSIPAIPEISRPVIRSQTPSAGKVGKRNTAIKSRGYQPQVKKYSVDKPAEPVITQKEVAAVLSKEELIQRAQKEATVDIDPYASVPEGAVKSGTIISTVKTPKAKQHVTSPAIKTLMIKARADLAIGNSQSAISSLERGLRIEAQNPELWHLLAQAHYDQSSYQQAITMAKKSIRYSSDSDLIAKNWALVKKAGERSGDTVVVKEALNYFKLNP